MSEHTEVKTKASEIIHIGQPDWLTYQRFIETVGGVDGYFELRNHEPRLLTKIMEAFGIELEQQPSEKVGQ